MSCSFYRSKGFVLGCVLSIFLITHTDPVFAGCSDKEVRKALEEYLDRKITDDYTKDFITADGTVSQDKTINLRFQKYTKIEAVALLTSKEREVKDKLASKVIQLGKTIQKQSRTCVVESTLKDQRDAGLVLEKRFADQSLLRTMVVYSNLEGLGLTNKNSRILRTCAPQIVKNYIKDLKGGRLNPEDFGLNQDISSSSDSQIKEMLVERVKEELKPFEDHTFKILNDKHEERAGFLTHEPLGPVPDLKQSKLLSEIDQYLQTQSKSPEDLAKRTADQDQIKGVNTLLSGNQGCLKIPTKKNHGRRNSNRHKSNDDSIDTTDSDSSRSNSGSE